jgi:hypothetical protein
MDVTVTSTIIWGVLWFVVGSGLAAMVFWTTIAVAGGIGALFKNPELGALFGFPVAWVLTVAWEIFVIVQVVIHIVTLVQLLTGTYGN